MFITRSIENWSYSLLQWHGIKELRRRGVGWYEVGEAFPNSLNVKEKGLNNYKKVSVVNFTLTLKE